MSWSSFQETNWRPILNLEIRSRSSHPEVFLEKGVLKICRKFIEIALRHGCSPVNLRHIFRTPFTKSTPGRLLLKVPPQRSYTEII